MKENESFAVESKNSICFSRVVATTAIDPHVKRKKEKRRNRKPASILNDRRGLVLSRLPGEFMLPGYPKLLRSTLFYFTSSGSFFFFPWR